MIQTGDTLWGIARQINPAANPTELKWLVDHIIALNPRISTHPDHIRIGDQLSLHTSWIMAMLQPAATPSTVPDIGPPSAPFLPTPTPQGYENLITQIARKYRGIDDLEAMAQISDWHAGWYPHWPTFLDKMSEAFLGVQAFKNAIICSTTAVVILDRGRGEWGKQLARDVALEPAALAEAMETLGFQARPSGPAVWHAVDGARQSG